MESGNETNNRCREEAVAFSARLIAVRQGRGGTDTGGQAADKDAGRRMQQPEPTGEDGAPAGFFSFERKNHGLAGRVQQNHREDMMGDLKKRASFARVVNYVNNPKKARLIDSKDVRLDDNATIARSMQGQADDKPGRKLKNPVYHISLDFAHEDAPKLTDDLMVEIAREYMRRMGITNTQYIVCRHTDREHQHLHIVANRVDNDGNTISDSNDNVRNVKVCKTLTREYGLHFSKGKMNVKRDRLRGKDKVKYQIYDAIKAALPHCSCWSDLCEKLAKQGIGVHFKLDRRNGNIVGVSFTKNEISFSGSRIDRSMSFYKLDRLFGSQIAEGMEWKPRVQEQPQPTRQDVGFHNNTTDTFIREPSPTKTEADGNGSTSTESGSNIVQVTIGTLMELCVQPHQAKVSSGGGGGGHENGWGENDNEKDKHKPRRRKR